MKAAISTTIPRSFAYGCIISSSLGFPHRFLRGGAWGNLRAIAASGASMVSDVPMILVGGAFASEVSHASTLIAFSVVYNSRISKRALTTLILCATSSCLLSRVSHGAIAEHSA